MDSGGRDGRHFLSSKPIPPQQRLIVALDLATVAAARDLVERLGDAVGFYKLGLELFMAGDYFEMVRWLLERRARVFIDLKFFDVPETVARAVRALSRSGATFATVHGNDAMLKAACEAKGDLKLLAVTVLTSLDQGDLTALGFSTDVHSLVLSRARRALAMGCDGIISSGLEAEAIRAEVGDRALIVVPGIRPVLNRPIDDQKRTVDVEEAFLKGADYIVVGRPIRDAADPRQAAVAIQHRIARLFAGSA